MFNTVALVGATGAVGRIMRDLLEARPALAKNWRFLASERSAGTKLTFRGREHTVELLTKEAFGGTDLVIATTPDEIAAEYLPAAVEAGCTVIDESGYWRMKEGVPLVIPEVNPQAALIDKGIIASPNCSTTQMVVALKPLHDAARVKRVIVSTYQAVSGVGLSGTKELEEGTHSRLHGHDYKYSSFPHPIAFNCIPQIGREKEAGYTSEEMKMVYETRKILGDPSILVSPTCVRIPVANGHSESITVETERPVSPEEARRLFESFPGIKVVDDLSQNQYPMPSTATGCDAVYIGRIRKDLSHANGLNFWCVSDNLRKGAATNAIQIAELLMKHRMGK